MALNAIRGAGLNLQFGTYLTLGAGETWLLPAGTWNMALGQYTFLEWFDPVSGIWRPTNDLACITGASQIESDGVNFRLANRTGTVMGARVTNVGSGYTSAPTVTASAGGSVYKAIVGGAISQTVTITAGGSNFTFPPILIIPPPTSGVPATATCTISAGAINAVTVVNQGAGYAAAPPVFIINDPRDTTGTGATLTAALTGAQTITAVLCTNQGSPQTSVPTLTFSGGGGSAAAASALLVATATAVTFSGATNAGNGNFALIPGTGTPPAQGAVINPIVDTGLYVPRNGYTTSVTTASPTTTVIEDGGLMQQWNGVTVTPVLVMNSNGTISGATTLGTNTFGGVSDTSFIQPA